MSSGARMAPPRNLSYRKQVIPLYKLLAATPANKTWAIEVFKKGEPGYHPLTIGSANKELGLN